MAAETVNPFDRREQDKRRRAVTDEEVNVGAYGGFDLLDDGRRAYPGFTLAKLEALLRDEFAAGFNVGEGTMERKVEEEILPRVRRNVWDKGHEAGMADGERDLLERIEELYGLVVHQLVQEIEPVLANDRARIADLRPLLSQSVNLLNQLVHAHHGGFARPMPF